MPNNDFLVERSGCLILIFMYAQFGFTLEKNMQYQLCLYYCRTRTTLDRVLSECVSKIDQNCQSPLGIPDGQMPFWNVSKIMSLVNTGGDYILDPFVIVYYESVFYGPPTYQYVIMDYFCKSDNPNQPCADGIDKQLYPDKSIKSFWYFTPAFEMDLMMII